MPTVEQMVIFCVVYILIGAAYSVFDYFLYIRRETLEAKECLSKSISALSPEEIQSLKDVGIDINIPFSELATREKSKLLNGLIGPGRKDKNISELQLAIIKAYQILEISPGVFQVFFWPFLLLHRVFSEISYEIYLKLVTIYEKVKLWVWARIMNDS